MKIQIIGYSGSGKSNLAWRLASHYNIPCLHLDGVQFYGNWDIRDDDEQNNIVRDFLAKNDNWVIDGNYSRIAPERFTQSDITIFLNYNRFYCYRKARQRAIENRGKIRKEPDFKSLQKVKDRLTKQVHDRNKQMNETSNMHFINIHWFIKILCSLVHPSFIMPRITFYIKKS